MMASKKSQIRIAQVCSNMNEAGDLEVKARPPGQSYEGCYWKIVGLRPTIFSGTPRNESMSHRLHWKNNFSRQASLEKYFFQ